MSANAAVEMLVEEHRVILMVVKGLEAVALAIRSGERVDTASLNDAVSFMREYADRFHHAKEEELLFPSFVSHGVPLHGCPIEALLHDHQRGRELVSALAKAIEASAGGDLGASQTIANVIGSIVELYSNHIWKEDVMVFPMAERLLPPEERARLASRCEAVAESFAPGLQTGFEAFARKFAAETAKD
jgi:hemerythrin-like domain-containing protein